ncbi:hypothetical protein GGI23_000010 [Coemansia sp. RSA 2559]|nr:hypothetical protein GGI23_000010 [Coemansia sp. RSA 2559]KAJ2869766.1 hypothetical protein GGI22_000008 [Coemansia erecta]
MARVIALISLAALLACGAFASAVADSSTCAHSGYVHVSRRTYGPGYGSVYGIGPGYGTGYGVGSGYGAGYGYAFGFPFASSFTNALNTNFNAANYNDDTLYVNNKDANRVSSNLNTFTNANTVV